MTFEDILNQALAMLQRQGRLTYQTLQLQFDLDEARLEVLKNQLLYAHPQTVSKDDQGLSWTGENLESAQHVQPGTDSEARFQTLLQAVMGLLQRERRVTYRELKYIFDVDDRLLSEIREELLLKQVAIDERGKVLVWTGDSASAHAKATISPSTSHSKDETKAIPAPLPFETLTADPTHGSTASLEELPTDFTDNELVVTPELVRKAPEAERRQLTVMFCDLVGSTDLSVNLDPEHLREVVKAYQETAAGVIHRYEGHIAQYLGDGLLIYFGWPQAHENDAERAVYSGLEIPEAIATLNTCLKADYGVELAVRIGIHTGPVVVGEMGGGGRHENLALGETPNIAARLEGRAPPNTVVISSVTAQLVQRSFILEELGPHELKGVAEPMRLYTVVAPQTSAHADDGAITSGFDALVGRDEEIGLLLRRWEQSKEGLGQVILLSGEAGIGKSSLVEGLRDHVRQEGLIRITFRCSPYHTNSAFYPIMEHVQRALNWQPEDTADTQLEKLEQGLKHTRLPLEEAVPLLALLLSLPLPEGRYPALSLSPEQQRQQTHDVLVAWLLEEAEYQPVLAVWEDLHWADPTTLENLGMLVDQAPTATMLHVLTFRPEFEPPWPSRSHMTPITLNRLERSQVEALIMRLAGGKQLPVEVVERIVGKTDGVPLYIEELTKMLLESSLLREEAEQYVLTGPLLTVAIPDTLQDSLMARLDQMNTAKEVAQLGAVLGREFPYAMLQAISSQDEATVRAGLTQLVEAELLYQRGRPPRANYLFKHALIQDAAYASLLKSTRQRVHQQIAQLLEARFPEVVETQPELVAHHYTEAGLSEPAVIRWQQAGQRAIEHSAHMEAVAHLRTGLEVLKTLPDTPDRARHELTLQRTLGVSLLVVRGYGAREVADSYIRARELCQQLGDTEQVFPVLWGLFLWYLIQAEFQTARELAEQYGTLAQRQQDPETHLWAYVMMGVVSFFCGEFVPARVHVEQGIALGSSLPRHSLHTLYGQDPGVILRVYAAHTLFYLGYPDQALATMHEAINLARTLTHPFHLARTLTWAAHLHELRGETQAAQEQAETAMVLCEEQGFVEYLEEARVMRGRRLVGLGRGTEGVTEMQQGVDAHWNIGAKGYRPFLLALLAEAYGETKQSKEGLVVVSEALEAVDKFGERWYAAELHRLKGTLLLLSSFDNQADAEADFFQALDIARQQQAKSWELRAAISLAHLWQQQGKRQDAYDLLAPVYNWFTEGFDTADLQEAKALLTELEG